MIYHSEARNQEQIKSESITPSRTISDSHLSLRQSISAPGKYTDNSDQLSYASKGNPYSGLQSGREFSHVRPHADDKSRTAPMLSTGIRIQRFPAEGPANATACTTCPGAEHSQASSADASTAPASTSTPEAAPAPQSSPSVEAPPTSTQATRPTLIVDDDTADLEPGQMRRSAFLSQLRTQVCGAVESVIAESGRSTAGCPYLARWFDFYSRQDSAHIEGAIHRYAPESVNATTAQGYISAVTLRARQSAETWAMTGRITGVPEGISLENPASSLLGGLVSAVGSIFFKARGGGAKNTPKPRAIQQRLGSGQPLDSAVRSRMESAFNKDFSQVRTHTDSSAAGLSDSLNARAFTVGNDVAFGSGEYRPGTLIGDALIAHEMAHVVQQGGSSASVDPMEAGIANNNALEADADISALGAVASIWKGANGHLSQIAQTSIPRLRSGLSLQRCQRETCSSGEKGVSVDLVKLRGSSRSPSTDLTTVNKIYKPCCVTFNTGKNETVPNKLSDTWLGGDTELKWGNTCGGVDPEEKSMWDGATKKYSLSSRMRVFYVATLMPSTALAYSTPPYCAIGDEAPYVDHAVISNSALNDTLAHEFGHILLNSGDHKGIDNPSDTKNLMYAPGRTGSNLDKSQCKKIYNNA